jgi:hypothetical protein
MWREFLMWFSAWWWGFLTCCILVRNWRNRTWITWLYGIEPVTKGSDSGQSGKQDHQFICPIARYKTDNRPD